MSRLEPALRASHFQRQPQPTEAGDPCALCGGGVRGKTATAVRNAGLWHQICRGCARAAFDRGAEDQN